MIRSLWRFTLFKQAHRYSLYRSFYIARIIGVIIQILKPRVVIDIGGGRSSWLRFVGDPEKVVTVDIDLKALENSLAAHKVRADAQYLPFRKIEGSLSISISILEHLPKFDKCLEDMIHVSDWIMIQLPNLRGFVEPHTATPLPFMISKNVLKAITRKYFPGLYVNFLCTKSNLIEFLKQRKGIFTILEWDYVYPSYLFYGVVSKLFSFSQLLPHGYLLLIGISRPSKGIFH